MIRRRIASSFAPTIIVTALSSLTGFPSVQIADAACQVYRSDPAFLADLQTDDFFKRVFPYAGKTSDSEQREKIRLLGQQRPPDQIGQLAQMEGLWRQSLVTTIPFTFTVPVPYEVEIRASRYPVRDLIKAEFDAEGDGRPEWVQEGPSIGESKSYTYDREGEYQSTLRLYDSRGQVYVSGSRLRVVSQYRFDVELQEVWNDFKESLRRNDLAAALECIHTQSRARYKKTLEAIPGLAGKVDEILADINQAGPKAGVGVYEMLRVKDGVTYSYQVRFGADFDAVWRIRSF
jgi:hypothetical protein